ncbi:MAG TPA: response regulator [Candidatus Saccharimonadales bacterium]|nr:response regulator [Candidatus Saccharimonadales bacterium]
MSRKVLVVEDNQASCELLVEALSSLECEVRAVRDGAAALQEVLSFRPKVVLMDIQLPLMDGVSVLRAIRRDPSLQSVRIIAVTAYAMQGDRERFLDQGFDGYLGKPYEVATMINEVRKALDAA